MNRYLKNSALLLSICLMSSALVASSTATPRQLSGFMPQTTSASSTLSATPALTSTSSSSLWSWFRWPSLPSFSWSAPSRETTYNIALASLLAATAYGGWRGWRYYQEQQRLEQQDLEQAQARLSAELAQIQFEREDAIRAERYARQLAETRERSAAKRAADEKSKRIQLELELRRTQNEQSMGVSLLPPAYSPQAQTPPPPYSEVVQQEQLALKQQAEQQGLREVEQKRQEDQQAERAGGYVHYQAPGVNVHASSGRNTIVIPGGLHSSGAISIGGNQGGIRIEEERPQQFSEESRDLVWLLALLHKRSGYKITNPGGSISEDLPIKKHNAKLKGLKYPNADLQEAELPGANLEGAFLPNVKLAGAQLPRANLQRANLSQSLPPATLGDRRPGNYAFVDVNFSGADLTGANLDNGSLFGADFTGAILPGASLKNTYIEQVKGLTPQQKDSAQW